MANVLSRRGVLWLVLIVVAAVLVLAIVAGGDGLLARALVATGEPAEVAVDGRGDSSFPVLCSCRCLSGASLQLCLHPYGSAVGVSCVADDGPEIAFGKCSNLDGRTCLGFDRGDTGNPRVGQAVCQPWQN